MEPEPLGGSWGRGGLPTPRGAHSPLGDQQGQEETFGGSEDQKGTQQAFPPPTQVPVILGSWNRYSPR